MKISNTFVTTVSLGILIGSATSSASISDLNDVHLDWVPRTQAEKERATKAVAPATQFSRPEKFEDHPAGSATVRARENADAFSQPSGNISFDRELDFKVGNGLFRKLWVSSPSSTLASDGLGPLYNARSCQRCHLKDGRGHPPENADDNSISMFLRISIPGVSNAMTDEIEGYLATLPDPTYGTQLQDFSVAGHPAEYQLKITYTEVPVELNEGGTVYLRQPAYEASNLGYGPLHPEAMLSPRVTPQMIGLGLLEAIPVEDILANADPDDGDGNGISGRPNVVWSVEFDQPMLGRFGLKAGVPTIKQQSAGAFVGDIGISNPLFPTPSGECTQAQTECMAAPNGANASQDGYEINEQALDFVTFYSRNLAVPARRNISDPEILRGKELFYATGCTNCHTPKFVTHRLRNQPEQSFQLIWPYTDLLLHDMGPELADNRPEARANGQEWRTPPLWGIGMTETVSGHTYFLHDGRARSLLEAVLWHGGEALPMQEAVVDMTKSDREALLQFLESL